MDASKFKDGPTISGPLEAFLQPGNKINFKRGKEVSEGFATISHVDVENKTIYFTSPLPVGIKAGDLILKGK